MAQRLPRFYAKRQQIEAEAKIARILLETGEPLPEAPDARTLTSVTHGDPARLRGIPAVSRLTSGAIHGTDPMRALLAKDRRRS